MQPVERVSVSKRAAALIQKLEAKHGELFFHQSGGCCDGSSPMCFEKGELMLNHTDVLLGSIEGCDFYMSEDQFEYWKHTHLMIDVTEGRGSSFSLEIPLGLRFITRSRLFTEDELVHLSPVMRYDC